jgi:hypothetical protein
MAGVIEGVMEVFEPKDAHTHMDGLVVLCWLRSRQASSRFILQTDKTCCSTSLILITDPKNGVMLIFAF